MSKTSTKEIMKKEKKNIGPVSMATHETHSNIDVVFVEIPHLTACSSQLLLYRCSAPKKELFGKCNFCSVSSNQRNHKEWSSNH